MRVAMIGSGYVGLVSGACCVGGAAPLAPPLPIEGGTPGGLAIERLPGSAARPVPAQRSPAGNPKPGRV